MATLGRKFLSGIFLVLILLSSFVAPSAIAQTDPATTPTETAPANNPTTTPAPTTTTPPTNTTTTQTPPANTGTPPADSTTKASQTELAFTWAECAANVANCIIVGIGELLSMVTSWLVGISGYLFDTVLKLSINAGGESSYKGNFITSGWVIIRDLCNIGFIFILLYIALGTILQLSGVDWKSLLVRLIIAALLINFSLFITGVVIDVSNILANLFYEAIAVPASAESGALANIKQVSGVFASGFEPQKILGPKLFSAFFNDKIADGAVTLGAVYLMAAIMNILVAFSFITGALLLLSRMAMLWFLLIASPIAFIASILGTKDFHKKWWEQLVNNAFLAPVFVFFLYLLVLIINPDNGFLGPVKELFNQTTGGAPDIFGLYAQIFIPLIIIMVFFNKSIDIAKSMAGEMGAGFTKFGTAALGAVAFGGAGMVGRQVLGRAGSWAASSEWLQSKAGNRLGELTLKGAQKMGGSSYDVRSFETLQKVPGMSDYGKGGGKGGFDKSLKDQVDSRKKFYKSLGNSKEGKENYIKSLQTRTRIPFLSNAGPALFEGENLDTLGSYSRQRGSAGAGILEGMLANRADRIAADTAPKPSDKLDDLAGMIKELKDNKDTK